MNTEKVDICLNMNYFYASPNNMTYQFYINATLSISMLCLIVFNIYNRIAGVSERLGKWEYYVIDLTITVVLRS